jgi:hypothetical protein
MASEQQKARNLIRATQVQYEADFAREHGQTPQQSAQMALFYREGYTHLIAELIKHFSIPKPEKLTRNIRADATFEELFPEAAWCLQHLPKVDTAESE